MFFCHVFWNTLEPIATFRSQSRQTVLIIFTLFSHFLFLDIKDLMFCLVHDFSQNYFHVKRIFQLFSMNRQSLAVVHFAYLKVRCYSCSSPEGNKNIFFDLFFFFIFPVNFSIERFIKCRICFKINPSIFKILGLNNLKRDQWRNV